MGSNLEASISRGTKGFWKKVQNVKEKVAKDKVKR